MMNKNCLRQATRSLVFVTMLGVSSNGLAIKQYEETLERDTWPEKIYQNSSSVLQLLPIRRLLARFEEDSKVHIEIRHPGGATGTNWGRELRAWLIGFGIPADYISLFPASGSSTKLVVLLLDRRPTDGLDQP